MQKILGDTVSRPSASGFCSHPNFLTHYNVRYMRRSPSLCSSPKQPHRCIVSVKRPMLKQHASVYQSRLSSSPVERRFIANRQSVACKLAQSRIACIPTTRAIPTTSIIDADFCGENANFATTSLTHTWTLLVKDRVPLHLKVFPVAIPPFAVYYWRGAARFVPTGYRHGQAPPDHPHR